MIELSDVECLLVKQRPSVNAFLDKFSIPEPTRSLLWVTDEDTSKVVSPYNYTITISVDLEPSNAPTKVITAPGHNIFAEPSLIWTKLEVGDGKWHQTDTNPYPASYAELGPERRYQYLCWLKDITQETETYFVQLYFSGLERHLFFGDYDGAIGEIMRLWKNHKNSGLDFYAPRSLAYTAVFRDTLTNVFSGGKDVFVRMPYLLDYMNNPILSMQKAAELPVNAKQVMDGARDVGFERINNIRKAKYAGLFESELKNRLSSFEKENGSIFNLVKIDLCMETCSTSAFIKNAALSMENIRVTVPNFMGSPTMKFILRNLLEESYKAAKDQSVRSSTTKNRRITAKTKKLVSASKIQVAREGSIAKEQLPYCYVYYPGSYGAFLGFKKTLTDQMTLCSCFKPALINYVKLRSRSPHNTNSLKNRNFILSSSDFPIELVKELMSKNVKNDSSVDEISGPLTFKEGLCHECNKATPSLNYTIPMYGGLFEQKYGWYIKKMSYELGIYNSFKTYYLTDICSPDIAKLIDEKNAEYEYLMSKRKSSPEARRSFELFTQMTKLNRVITTKIENMVRAKFGFKNVGEEWTGETTLFYILKKLLPGMTVIHHYRPSYLKGMEFDIYVREINVAFEYQGVQHFHPVEHWGGPKSLIELQERDNRKNKIASDLGIPLVYFYFDENLTEDLVYGKIKDFVNKTS